MKLFKKVKDGGKDSNVTAYFLIEWKRFFSVAVLKFEDGSREAFHSHAFSAISWVLKGELLEKVEWGTTQKKNIYTFSFKPIKTGYSVFHQVFSFGTTWVLTFRGPWKETWEEYLPDTEERYTLKQGREKVNAPNRIY